MSDYRDLVTLETQLHFLRKDMEERPADPALLDAVKRLERTRERVMKFLEPTLSRMTKTAGTANAATNLSNPLAIPKPGDRIVFSWSNLWIDSFLDGATGSGIVGLAPNPDPPYSGTHWEVLDAGVIKVTTPNDPHLNTTVQTVHLKSLSQPPGAFPYLDGDTNTGHVGLAPSTGWPYSGTRWVIYHGDPNPERLTPSFELHCVGGDSRPFAAKRMLIVDEKGHVVLGGGQRPWWWWGLG